MSMFWIPFFKDDAHSDDFIVWEKQVKPQMLNILEYQNIF